MPLVGVCYGTHEDRAGLSGAAACIQNPDPGCLVHCYQHLEAWKVENNSSEDEQHTCEWLHIDRTPLL